MFRFQITGHNVCQGSACGIVINVSKTKVLLMGDPQPTSWIAIVRLVIEIAIGFAGTTGEGMAQAADMV